MGECSGNKKSSRGLFPSTRGSGSSSMIASNSRDQNIRVCSRLGCSSRISLTSRTPTGVSNKTKSVKQPFQLFSSTKETTGSSSKQPLSVSGPSKSGSDHRIKLPSQRSTNFESNNGRQNELHLPGSGLTAKSSRIRHGALPDVHACRESTSTEASSSSLTKFDKSGKKACGKHERSDCATPGSSTSSTSLTFRSGSCRARNDASTNVPKIMNVKCNPMSEAAQSGCSSSSSMSSLGREMGRKRNSKAKSSSSAKEKKVNGALVDDRKLSISNGGGGGGGGISISDSRKDRNSAASRSGNSSNRGISSSSDQGVTVRSMLNAQENKNKSQRSDASISRPSSTQLGTPRSADAHFSGYCFRSQSSSCRTNTSTRPGSSSESLHSNSRSSPSSEVAFGPSPTTRENFRTYNLDGIAEMLLTLDRIEHAGHLTYEHMIFLESNIYLGGLSFHDRHRDMRLDIDNMTYEELLALEERMGTVSTALTEEALEQCLKRSIFHGSSSTGAEESHKRAVVAEHADEIKCCICQEEYTYGDELGKLGCEHRYHVDCITKWLKLKNWCPICKASAQPSTSST